MANSTSNMKHVILPSHPLTKLPTSPLHCIHPAFSCIFPPSKQQFFYRQSKPICSMKYLPTFGPLWAIIGVYDICWKKNPPAWSNMGRLSQRSSASSIICCRFRSASSAFWRSTYVRVARGKKDQRSTCSFVPLSQNIFELLPQVEYPSTCMCVCACIVTY